MLTGAALLSGCATTESTPKTSAQAHTPIASSASARVSVTRSSWPAGGSGGELISTAHHRIYSTVTNPVIDARLPAFLEDSLLHYRTAFSPIRQPVLLPQPVRPITSYVMGSRNEWAKLTAQQLPPHRARRYLQIQRGGFAERGVGYYFDIGTQDTFAVAAHEGWHQYTQTTFRSRLAPWIDEGCATYCEGFRWSTTNRDRAVFAAWSNVERFDRLRDANRVGSLLSLRELLSARPEVLLAGSADATLDYYAQLWALIHFLVEGENGRYFPGLSRVLQDAASGKLRLNAPTPSGFLNTSTTRGQRLFIAYISPDLDRVSTEYAAFVERVVAPGSKQAIVAGKSPITHRR